MMSACTILPQRVSLSLPSINFLCSGEVLLAGISQIVLNIMALTILDLKLQKPFSITKTVSHRSRNRKLQLEFLAGLIMFSHETPPGIS